MRIKFSVISIIVIAFYSGIAVSAQSLAVIDQIAIQPLKSTRHDVEKIGTQIGSNRLFTEYQTELGKLHVEYSKEPCIWHGWNIPPDRVIEYRLYPEQRISKKDNEQVLKGLPLYVDDTFTLHFSDSSSGIQYVFQESDGQLSHIKRTPTPANAALRCEGFPQYSVAADTYNMSEDYEMEDPDRWDVGLLFNYFFDLKKSDQSKGTLFIYAPKGGRQIDRSFLKKIEKYAFDIIGVPKDRLRIELGGLREKAEIEAAIVFKDAPNPIPRPKYPHSKPKKRTG